MPSNSLEGWYGKSERLTRSEFDKCLSVDNQGGARAGDLACFDRTCQLPFSEVIPVDVKNMYLYQMCPESWSLPPIHP